MRYGICTGLENLEVLEELGYDYLEASVTAVLNLPEKVRKEYEEKLKNSKVKCEAFNILFPKTMELLGPRADQRQLTDYLHKAFAAVSALGGKVVVFGSGKCRTCPKGYDYRQAYRELADVCRTTGEVALNYGVQVVIEPLSRSETNFICTLAEGAMLQADTDHKNVSLLADYYHVMANHDSIESVETIGGFGHIHIAAAKGRKYPLSLEGEQYQEFMSGLKASGYDGRISIEGKTENLKKDGAAALWLLKQLEAEEWTK